MVTRPIPPEIHWPKTDTARMVRAKNIFSGGIDMKLMIAIVQDADRSNLAHALRRAKIRHTRLNTMGGFLRQGNTTFLIGLEESQVESTLKIIHEHCHERDVLHRPGAGAMHPDAYVSPTYVQVGGATIFMVDAESYRL